ncbi:single-stranded DNA-specific DHH superfamily exonuclease [Pseudomonas sp. SJZ079]|uniref:acetyltransferase n=1 Tax=Pseudomonas sp. SJZ079 TaxID=2572887 RepID=UPI00119BAB50|nr:acetyltransferase [Pseudomonas sp. SJZ079]TWC38556.1 single-stranded DNA-specific DHH superfamily exonuclease [Pseudomonas sp. SJZ079]
MSDYFVFNGDADGLCALQQLHLAEAPRATLVTGVKRDIALLRRVQAGRGERVTVLDLSHAQNHDDVQRLLRDGASLRYFDHHFAGELPQHARFESYIDSAAEVCTSALVNRYLDGRHPRWAVVGAFGDAMPRLAQALAQGQGQRLTAGELARLEQLGRYLNYNAYGESLADLHFDPAALAEALAPFADPLDFIRASPVFAALREGYAADMRKAATLVAEREVAGARLFRLPDAAWARRVSGVLANELLRQRPEQALALLSPLSSGGFSVSLRVPASHDLGADDFCRRFATGGGRKRAAGINLLPEVGLEPFASAFEAAFARA